MQIGTLSKRTGISVRMLRYYEAEGLLCPSRRASGYRDYGPEDEDTVRRIRTLNEAGLRLELIRRFLPCVKTSKPDFDPCPDLLAALTQEAARLDDRMAELQQSRDMIGQYLQDVRSGM
ncbi:MAG: MerR family transcriptional regulator [Paracoccus sp. (in: a-proteobacteria)]|uniref:MerR family transcriptional regulator n=1 Tax=Paracoccus sp. TaxID=267 RepID=UPI0026DFCF6D|nr:MerR family transcriptional regulator [Paracoccus sp. (in: a-proteobacteria)]MDO5631725.1 MerR family transcriptional regulator [Paracoccus sp. (in: a-proteobacteria)]